MFTHGSLEIRNIKSPLYNIKNALCYKNFDCGSYTGYMIGMWSTISQQSNQS